MSDRVEGAAREFGGRVQEFVGNLAGDARTQAGGLIRLPVRPSRRSGRSVT